MSGREKTDARMLSSLNIILTVQPDIPPNGVALRSVKPNSMTFDDRSIHPSVARKKCVHVYARENFGISSNVIASLKVIAEY